VRVSAVAREGKGRGLMSQQIIGYSDLPAGPNDGEAVGVALGLIDGLSVGGFGAGSEI
jgi:hypothetical protein